MTIRAWRITKAKHAATAFTGGGAKAYGGRWNSPGTAAVYTAGSTSLAILEMLVPLQAQDLMRRYVVFEVSFDEMLMTSVDPATLPKSWRKSPSPASVQPVGDEWVAEGSSAVMRLPSVNVPSEWNYLLNPAHPDFAKIAIGPKQQIKLDPRLVKTSTP
jgi:RES domain-containing protein